MRIQKYLSEQNILSRRKAEEYIQKGWIKVNGTVITQLGTKISPDHDIIELTPEGQKANQKTTVIAFHKPVGIVSNCPEPGQIQITDLLPKELSGLSTIGRLDRDSEGLILLTNDGVLAKKLLDHHYVRKYVVRVDKPLTKIMIQHLEEGVMILGKMTLPTTVTQLSSYSFMIELNEGRNRQIRRMAEKVGLRVVKLKRVSYGPVELGDLKKGEYRILENLDI